MNTWFRRAVGTVGIAGGVLLLGAGTAHADDSVPAAKDPQQLQGLFDDLLTPAGGPSNMALSMDAPVDTPANSVPGVLGSLPISDASRTAGLGELSGTATEGATSDTTRLPLLETLFGTLGLPGMNPSDLTAHPTNAVPVAGQRVTHAVPASTVPAGIDAPNSIGDDLVDQPTEALPLGGLPDVTSGLPGLDGAGLPQPDSDLPVLDGRGVPTITGVPAVGGLPSATSLPGASALPVPTARPVPRSAERPVARDTTESAPAAPLPIPTPPLTVSPDINLPIFDSLPDVPAVPNLDAVGQQEGLGVGPQINPAAVNDLPIFSALLSQL